VGYGVTVDGSWSGQRVAANGVTAESLNDHYGTILSDQRNSAVEESPNSICAKNSQTQSRKPITVLFPSHQSLSESWRKLVQRSTRSSYFHIREIITNCSQTLHALRVLWCHGLPGDAVQTVYRATVVTKLLYACCAWSVFITASDRKRVDVFLRRSKRCGFCPPDLPPFNDLIKAQEDQLFSTHSIYFTTSYHYRQLLLKATISCTELFIDLCATTLHIQWRCESLWCLRSRIMFGTLPPPPQQIVDSSEAFQPLVSQI